MLKNFIKMFNVIKDVSMWNAFTGHITQISIAVPTIFYYVKPFFIKFISIFYIISNF
jgi:hypothetical protein